MRFIMLIFMLANLDILVAIEQLNSDLYKTREDASKKLRKMGERPIPLLIVAAQKHRSLEVQYRSKNLVNNFIGSIRPTKYSQFPWIDSHPDEFPNKEMTKKYLTDYQYDVESKDWIGYRHATQKLVVDLVYAGISKKEIVEVLDKMVEKEKIWWEKDCESYGRREYPEYVTKELKIILKKKDDK